MPCLFRRANWAIFLPASARDTKQRNCWPEPFVYADRAALRQAMAVQESAGWERQNLLSEFHFLPGGNELNEAGRMRVQWIMNEVSEPYRQVYVHRADTPQETAAADAGRAAFCRPVALRRQCPRAGIDADRRRMAGRPHRSGEPQGRRSDGGS